jgi:1-deoxy-D-xylulose-5-phosphate synthase
MLATGLARDEGPSSIRYPRGSGLGVSLEGDPTPLTIGTSETLLEGEDLCILAVGSMVPEAMAAADILAKAGLSTEVVDMRFIKPLDVDLLGAVWSRHRLVVTVEENSLAGGFGAAVLEWAVQSGVTRRPQVLNLGIPDAFQEHASRSELLDDLGLTGKGVARRIQEVLEERGDETHAQSAS